MAYDPRAGGVTMHNLKEVFHQPSIVSMLGLETLRKPYTVQYSAVFNNADCVRDLYFYDAPLRSPSDCTWIVPGTGQ